MSIKKILLATAALLLANAAQAQIAVTADVGTTGIGAHLIVPMEKTLNGRFGGHFFTYDKGDRFGSVNYDTKNKMRTFDVLFDWYVFNNSPLHATAGVMYNGSKISATAQPNADGGYIINGKPYTAKDVATLTGKIEYRKVAPYLGIGWGNPLTSKSAWSLTGDLGVYFQGKPKSQLASVGCVSGNVLCNALARDVAAHKPSFQADADSYKVYPVLRVGAAYRF